MISQQDLATCAYCFPHKYSSLAWQNYVYVPYTLLINSLIREQGTKKATNGLKRDKNEFILCNVSFMEVLAPLFGIKKPLPPLLQKHSGYFFLFPGSAQSGIEAEALRPEVVLHITSSLTILKRTRTRCNQLYYISQGEINI